MKETKTGSYNDRDINVRSSFTTQNPYYYYHYHCRCCRFCGSMAIEY